MEKQTEQKPLQLEDLLKVPDHSPHDHRPHDHSPHDDSTHDHILNPVGKIFDDQFSAVTEITTTGKLHLQNFYYVRRNFCILKRFILYLSIV
jgi:hypothetical protein